MRYCPHCGGDLDAAPTLALEAPDNAPRDLGFSAWWERYPRKVAKLAAQRAYMAAVKGKRATTDELMAGLEAYARTNPDPKFIPHAATWLNAGRWQDAAPTPVKTRADPVAAVRELAADGWTVDDIARQVWLHLSRREIEAILKP